MNFTHSHDLPPSVVLKRPRSLFGPQQCPSAATNATSGFVGWTTTRPMWCVSARPQLFHVLPPSVERYTPLPQLTEFRGLASPVPTYTTSGLPWHTATAPTHCVGWSSKTGLK